MTEIATFFFYKFSVSLCQATKIKYVEHDGLEHTRFMCENRQIIFLFFLGLALLFAEYGARLRQIKYPAKQLSVSYV